MKNLVWLGLLLAGCASQGAGFHAYSPSRATGAFMVVKAEETKEGLKLSIDRRVEIGFKAAAIVAHPEKPLLYVAGLRGGEDGTSGAVIRLNPDGTYKSHTRIPVHHGYAYLSIDKTRAFLLGVSYFGGQVDIYRLKEDGSVGERVFALDENRTKAHCILPSPDNKFLYIPYVKDNNALYQYAFDEKTGKMTALAPKDVGPPAGTGPRHMAYHPTQPMVYFSNEQHLGVSVYEKTGDGTLKLRQVCDAVPKDKDTKGISSSDIAITPDGRYLFAGIRGHSQDFDHVSRYRVLENGEVELLGLTPADAIPWGLTLSPDGRYLLVTAFKGGTLTAFRIGGDGSLTKAASVKWDPQISDIVAR